MYFNVKVAEYCVAFPVETFMMKIECKSDWKVYLDSNAVTLQ